MTREGYLYVLKFKEGNVIKIGRTINIDQRLSAFGGASRYDLANSYLVKGPQANIIKLESQLKREFLPFKCEYTGLTSGNTEIFRDECFDEVIDEIQHKVNKFPHFNLTLSKTIPSSRAANTHKHSAPEQPQTFTEKLLREKQPTPKAERNTRLEPAEYKPIFSKKISNYDEMIESFAKAKIGTAEMVVDDYNRVLEMRLESEGSIRWPCCNISHFIKNAPTASPKFKRMEHFIESSDSYIDGEKLQTSIKFCPSTSVDMESIHHKFIEILNDMLGDKLTITLSRSVTNQPSQSMRKRLNRDSNNANTKLSR